MGVKGLFFFFFLLPTMMLWRIETGQRDEAQERYETIEAREI
jgi:hypothetical protein